MAPARAFEEQRFDFGVADQPGEPASTKRSGRVSAAAALQRRVEEVAAARLSRQALRADACEEHRDGDSGRDATGEGDGWVEVAEPEDGGKGPGPGLAEAGPDARSFSIAEFYERVRMALSRAFPEEVWVVGEIRGLRESRGHHYLELADERADDVGRRAQQLEVVCWSRDWPAVEAALVEAGVSLEVGRVVRVRGRVSVWEGGSKLRFTLTALDVEALLGGIAVARRRLLETLAREGLLDANRTLPLPLVPLRIGLVTSPGSEAHRDFVGQLDRSGFAFDVRLEASLVQGPEAPEQLAAALRRLAAWSPELGVVVRGGGARGDLAAFDSELVARAIATAPFPVWTGIGHTGDRSVADEVASRALVTPTACGEAVVAVVDEYWGGTLGRAEALSRLARARLDAAAERLRAGAGSVGRGTRHQLHRRADELASMRARLPRSARALAERDRRVLDGARTTLGLLVRRVTAGVEGESRRHREVLRAYDPRRQLERGWSLTRDASGRLLRSVEGLSSGEELRTIVSDGEIASTVSNVQRRAPGGRA